MGLLDIFNVGLDLDRLRRIDNTDPNDPLAENYGDAFKVSLRERETPKGAFDSAPFFIKGPVNYFVPKGTEGTGQVKIPFTDKTARIIPESAMSPARTDKQKKTSASIPMGTISKIPAQDASATTVKSETTVKTIPTKELAQDGNFLTKLSDLIGMDFSKAAADWKDKGGFEGLMANPAFTMGLAFMQAGAEGKSIGAAGLDSVAKAAGISQQYKKILEAKKEAPIQATAADISETKNLLSKVGISEGNWFENFGSKVANFFNKNKGSRNPGLDYDKAVEEITVQYQAAVKAKQEQLKAAGKPQILRIDDKIKIMEKLIKDGTIQKNSAWFGGLFTDDTLQKREHGGPVHKGQSYIVGEAGPEIMIPHSSGNVIANDDAQVFNMLLASNPQLQKVSKERAMKILKAKFPEYFD